MLDSDSLKNKEDKRDEENTSTAKKLNCQEPVEGDISVKREGS